ncbi:MAG TPA: tetratricopeptide repeat protein [Anaerolineaceae bacterium]|nr:tetratricopeptide repeat protein [Anaerolineaceae bacterium]HPN53321.1 tetratricopeptide repeat protein [Anaerolineaceae bacterium]
MTNKTTPTFLFTDIEGSTRLWENDPQSMKLALQRHDAILREAINTHNGLIFKTVGDAFCATFSTPIDALRAALSAQRACLAEPWQPAAIRVRMALHTGAAEERDGDYFGQPVNRVARLVSAGHGGQILLSQACQELLRDDLPPLVSLKDLGERRLKDLIRPERIFQVVGPGLPADFPALRTLEVFRHNLPIQNTSFIGREREIQLVKEHLAQHRLVTLSGPGGTGKTRLSLQVGAEMVEAFEDGVWLVELAPVSEPERVLSTAAATFGLRTEQDSTIEHSFINYLRDKELLLILDNCEHLVVACALFVEKVLQACPRVTLLTSTREALSVPGEAIIHVPSLTLPGPHETQDPGRLTQYEAVRLFIDRAESYSDGFQVNRQNAPAIAQICHRLDGIPLALELAAARVRVLTVEQIAARLDDRFRLLTGGSRSALPRQQTLRALIDWSYDLLSASERKILCWFSAFSNGWTLEAAEALCQAANEPEGLDILISLVNKSLVIAEPQPSGQTRYRMLETIRRYAMDRLQQSGGTTLAHTAHLEYFLDFSRQAESQLWQAGAIEWLNRLEMEHDNLRAAIEWSFAARSPGIPAFALELACNIARFWQVRGHWQEAVERLTHLLQQPASQLVTELHARGFNELGKFYQLQGYPEKAAPCFEQALAISRNCGSRVQEGFALSGLGQNEAALAIFEAEGHVLGQIEALSNLGWAAVGAHQPQAGLEYYGRALTLCRAHQHLLGIANALISLYRIEVHANNRAKAKATISEALQLYRQANDRPGILQAVSWLGGLYLGEGNLAEATSLIEETIEISKDTGNPIAIANAYTLRGELLRGEKEYQRAIEAYETAIAIRREHPEGIPPYQVAYTVHLINMGFVTFFMGDTVRSFEYVKEMIFSENAVENSDYCLLAMAAHAAKTRPLLAARWYGGVFLAENNLATPFDLEDCEAIRGLILQHCTQADFDLACAEGRSLAQAGEGVQALIEECRRFCIDFSPEAA